MAATKSKSSDKTNKKSSGPTKEISKNKNKSKVEKKIDETKEKGHRTPFNESHLRDYFKDNFPQYKKQVTLSSKNMRLLSLAGTMIFDRIKDEMEIQYDEKGIKKMPMKCFRNVLIDLKLLKQ